MSKDAVAGHIFGITETARNMHTQSVDIWAELCAHAQARDAMVAAIAALREAEEALVSAFEALE